jgi:predicted nucleic acid-binding protein
VNPPSTLLDHSFLVAVADADDEHHAEAVGIYRSLIEDFVDERCLLVARADQLAAVDQRDLFASVDKVHIARQQRNAAADLAGRTEIDGDLAITLVLIHRLRLRKVATFDPRLASYDIDIVTAGSTPDDTTSPADAESN